AAGTGSADPDRGWSAGGMPAGVLAGDRQRVECGSGDGSTCGGRPAVDRAGSDEDGDRGSCSVCSRNRKAQLRPGQPGYRRAEPGDAAAGGVRMKAKSKPGMNLAALRARYASRQTRPSDVVAEVYDAIAAEPLNPVWISLVPRETALARASA